MVIAVSIVVFLHMVVGEMAPKSWAISHPESSALLIAIPFRAFTWTVRPILFVLNGLANACLRLVKVDPIDTVESATHGPADLQLLLAESLEHGVLPDADHPSGTISNAIPGVGKLVARTIADASGGHRHGFHTILAGALVTLLAVLVGRFLIDVPGLGATPVGPAIATVALIAFAVKARELVRSWSAAWGVGILAAAAVVVFAKRRRFMAVGFRDAVAVAVVFAPLGTEGISVISMRRASRKERARL